MIKVKKEPDGILLTEYCFFCYEPTQYWSGEGDIPVCRDCAKTYSDDDLTEKKDLIL